MKFNELENFSSNDIVRNEGEGRDEERVNSCVNYAFSQLRISLPPQKLTSYYYKYISLPSASYIYAHSLYDFTSIKLNNIHIFLIKKASNTKYSPIIKR